MSCSGLSQITFLALMRCKGFACRTMNQRILNSPHQTPRSMSRHQHHRTPDQSPARTQLQGGKAANHHEYSDFEDRVACKNNSLIILLACKIWLEGKWANQTNRCSLTGSVGGGDSLLQVGSQEEHDGNRGGGAKHTIRKDLQERGEGIFFPEGDIKS